MNTAVKVKPRTILRYELEPEKLFKPELGEYHTYGVRLITPELTEVLHDVSVNRKTSEHIVKLLNRHQVSPVHLHDVVIDLIP